MEAISGILLNNIAGTLSVCATAIACFLGAVVCEIQHQEKDRRHIWCFISGGLTGSFAVLLVYGLFGSSLMFYTFIALGFAGGLVGNSLAKKLTSVGGFIEVLMVIIGLAKGTAQVLTELKDKPPEAPTTVVTINQQQNIASSFVQTEEKGGLTKISADK